MFSDECSSLLEARALLVPDEYGTVSFSALAVWMHKNGAALLDVAEQAKLVSDVARGSVVSGDVSVALTGLREALARV